MGKPDIRKDVITQNIQADGKGSLPDWYTHFGGEEFALSALQSFLPALRTAYPSKSVGRIVALGAGNAFYERTVAKELHRTGWNIQRLFATDLQQASLDEIPQKEPIPVTTLLADATALPSIPKVGKTTLVLSRAVEHYLPAGGLEAMVRETGKLLEDRELYVAQISSGTHAARTALSAGLAALAGKHMDYLSLDEYLQRVQGVKDGATSLFRLVSYGNAKDQPRTSVDQARRYLTPAFLKSHNLNHSPFTTEVEHLTLLRHTLELQVRAGNMDRNTAIQQLNAAIESTSVFSHFREIFTSAVRNALQQKRLEAGKGVKFIHGGRDVEIDVEYPVVIWQRQSHPSSRTRHASTE